MNAALGIAGVTIGLGAALLGVISVLAGLRQKRPRFIAAGARYSVIGLAGTVLAFAGMERALITRDFRLAYVQKVGGRATPPLFNFASLWSSLEGSILLWTLVLALYVALVVRKFRRRLDDPLMGWALIVMFTISAFFNALMLGPANPFRIAATVAADGPGPNPLLQNHVLMLFHPPILYLGLVGFSVPFAFATAALITGRLGEGWLVETRRWTLFAWGFLTIGIVLGAWWSYEVTGWGGYWSWDPVENAVFLPWLTGTAYIHSVMVQERRGMLRVWNLSLLCATFSLTILETFLTRSGVLDSVHSFSESDIGPWLLSFFGLVVAVTIALIGWRGDRLRSPGTIDSPVSREAAFLVNNLLFAAFAFVVLLGTVFPLVVEAVRGDRLSVGRPFFDRMTTPIGLALLTMMAIAPVLPWRKASGELLRARLLWPAWMGVGALVFAAAVGARGFTPLVAFGLGGFAGGAALRQVVLASRRQGWRGFVGRANGGMIVHLGVVIVAVAVAASQSYAKVAEVKLKPNESAIVHGHTITYLGMETVQESNRITQKARVRVDGDGVYAPALQSYDRGDVVATPSVRVGLKGDVYLSLDQPPATSGGAVGLKVVSEPLAMWLWVGGGIMAGGTALAAFPGRRRRPTDPVSAPLPVDRELVAVDG
ncbi:MAG: heme lyase CcmF/NrfE family subunit [Acidimicrobiales bacterium]